MNPVRVTAPATAPVSAAEIKRQVRRAWTDNDDIDLEAYVDAATSHLDGFDGVLGRALMTQTWRIGLATWPGLSFPLPMPDVSSVTVTYRDSSDTEQTLNSDTYVLETLNPPFVWWKREFENPDLSDAHPNPITIEFECGYGAARDVPAPIRQAIRMLAAHWFNTREAVGPAGEMPVPLGFKSLIAPYKWASM